MTKANHQLSATVRTLFGRKVNKLRKDGILPATVYGADFKPVSIQINQKEIEHLFDEVGESGLVELNLDKEKLPVIFRNPQYHPLFGTLIHVDCYKVNLKEKISAVVPLEFVGESPAVKEGNIFVEVTNEVEVEALPADLPESITVDISKLENLESMISVADLVFDKSKVEILTAADQLIAKVEEPRVEEEPVATEEVAPGEVPATAQKSPEELAAAEAEAKKEKDSAKQN